MTFMQKILRERSLTVCYGSEIVDCFFHGIADMDNHRQWNLTSFCPGMAKHPFNLGVASLGVDPPDPRARRSTASPRRR
jgi:hypothetical protein